MSAAFDVVFGLFVTSMLVIAFTAVRWGRRRDRAARAGTAPRGLGRRAGPTPPADGSGSGRTPDAAGGAGS